MRRLPLGLLVVLASAGPASATSILFVSDSTTDATNIPFVLSGGSAAIPHPTIAGATLRPAASGAFHDVTIVENDYTVTGGVVFAAEGTNPTLAGLTAGVSLNDYNAVYWSASGPHEPDTLGGGLGADGGLHTDAAVFTSLVNYVSSGGFVFVTGHDALTDPADPLLLSFAGGTGAAQATDVTASLVATVVQQSFLSTGVVETLGGSASSGGVSQTDGVQDLDYLTGLGADTLGAATGAGGTLWSVRVPSGIGDVLDSSVGQIAYVSNGVFLFEDLPFNPGTFLSDGEDASWLTDGVYNAALLNWAAAASVVPVPEPAVAALLALGLAGLAVRRQRLN